MAAPESDQAFKAGAKGPMSIAMTIASAKLRRSVDIRLEEPNTAQYGCTQPRMSCEIDSFYMPSRRRSRRSLSIDLLARCAFRRTFGWTAVRRPSPQRDRSPADRTVVALDDDPAGL